MTTHQDFIYSSTPVNKYLVKELGLIRGAIASKIIYACNLKDSVCRMGQRRKAEELGIDRTTVSKGEKFLIEAEYIVVAREATATEPYHLKPTKKLIDLIKTVDLINPPVDDVNPPVDLITQEEESKEESKEETTSSSEIDENLSTVTKHYENEIGLLSPIIAEEIKDSIDTYPVEWIIDSITISAKQNKRRWSYVEGILRKWRADGKTNNGNGNGTKPEKEREKIIDPITGEWTGGYYG